MTMQAEWKGIDEKGRIVRVAEMEISSTKEYSDKEIIHLEVCKRIIPIILLEDGKQCFRMMKLQIISKDYQPDGYHYAPKGTIMRVYDYDMLKELLG